MKEIIRQVRLLIAEKLIGLTLSIMPECPDRKLWARHVELYMRSVMRRMQERLN